MQHIDEADVDLPSVSETFVRVMCIDGNLVRGRSMLEMYSFDNAEEIIDINVYSDDYRVPDSVASDEVEYDGTVLSFVALNGTLAAVRLMLEFGADVSLIQSASWKKDLYHDLIVEHYQQLTIDHAEAEHQHSISQIPKARLWHHCYPPKLLYVEDIGDYLPSIENTAQDSKLSEIQVLTTILSRHGSLFYHFPLFHLSPSGIISALSRADNVLNLILQCDLISYDSRSTLCSTVMCIHKFGDISTPYSPQWVKLCTNVMRVGLSTSDSKRMITPWMIISLFQSDKKGNKQVLKLAQTIMQYFLDREDHSDKFKKMAMSAILYGSPHSMPIMKCIVETYFYHFYYVNREIEDIMMRTRASRINGAVYFSDSDFRTEASLNKAIARCVKHDGKIAPLPIPDFPAPPHYTHTPHPPSPTHSRLCYVDGTTIPQTVLHKICLEGGGGCTKRVEYILKHTLGSPWIANGNGETAFHLACLKALVGVIDFYLDELQGGKVDALAFPSETRYSEYAKSEYVRGRIRRKEREEGAKRHEYVENCSCDNVYTGSYYWHHKHDVNYPSYRNDVWIYVWPPTACMSDEGASTTGSVDTADSSEPPKKRAKTVPEEQEEEEETEEKDVPNNKKTALMVACDSNYYNPITVSHLIRKRECDVEVEDSCGENVVIQAIKDDNEVVTLKLLSLCHRYQYMEK